MTDRAATHTDPAEDAILAAWQRTPDVLRQSAWLSFRAGYREALTTERQARLIALGAGSPQNVALAERQRAVQAEATADRDVQARALLEGWIRGTMPAEKLEAETDEWLAREG